jgi:tetratricopeptide (TPR) repeat protein
MSSKLNFFIVKQGKNEMDLQDAKQLASAHDYASAQKLLKQILTRDPKNIEAWLVLAEVVQKPEISEKCLQQVLKIDPGNPVALQKLNQPHSPQPESQQADAHPAPQSLDERLQDVAQPSPEMADLWENSAQVSPASDPAPQTLDEPLQRVAQPSMELDDPWEISTQVSPASAPPPPPEPASTAPPPEKPPDSVARPEKPGKSGRWLEFSLIGVLVVMVICVLGLFLGWPDNAAGEDQSAASEAEPAQDDPFAVIIANIRASNAESIPHYMATIHSKSPAYQSTKQMTAEAFDLFDLSYQISGLKINNQTKNEVVVAFTLTTRKIRGPSFRDNRINGDMILRQEDDRWKIYNQVVHDIKYLN